MWCGPNLYEISSKLDVYLNDTVLVVAHGEVFSNGQPRTRQPCYSYCAWWYQYKILSPVVVVCEDKMWHFCSNKSLGIFADFDRTVRGGADVSLLIQVIQNKIRERPRSSKPVANCQDSRMMVVLILRSPS